MEILVKFLLQIWIYSAIIMSLFWGVRSIFLFSSVPKKESRYFLRKTHPKLAKFFMSSYQFIFNFVVSFAGWCCFYVLIVRVNNKMPSFNNIDIYDILLFIISLLGLTGHLPQALSGILDAFSELGERALNKLMKKKE